jgi:hypothetical protein
MRLRNLLPKALLTLTYLLLGSILVSNGIKYFSWNAPKEKVSTFRDLADYKLEIVPLYREKVLIIEKYFRASDRNFPEIHEVAKLARQWSGSNDLEFRSIEDLIKLLTKNVLKNIGDLRPETAKLLKKDLEVIDKKIEALQKTQYAVGPEI